MNTCAQISEIDSSFLLTKKMLKSRAQGIR